MTRPLLSIIIPIYNEEEILVSSINKTIETVCALTLNYEVVIVDDGSRDNTSRLLSQYFSGLKNTTVVTHQVNTGFGSAVRTGIQKAIGTYLLCVPVDSPLSKQVFDKFLTHLHHADVLVSYRRERLGYSWWMKLNSELFHFLVSKLFSLNLRDYNWIHLYHRRIFDEGEIQIEYDGLFMLAEILIKAKRKGFTFFEFEVEQNQRITGIASASRLVNVMRTLRDILHFRFFN